ncbi:MAG: hypothetical protein EGR15_09345 [Lachnospiraceae bacterium]|nr:hypothetical protein [Lachnospiraceae bacterium]
MKIPKKASIVAIIILAVLEIVAQVVPSEKTPTFWISDAAVGIAIIIEVVVYYMAIKNRTSMIGKIYGWPIVTISLHYLTVLTACGLILTVLSVMVHDFPIWISIAVYAILYGSAAIQIIAASSTRDYLEAQDTKVEEKTLFMRKLYSEANSLKGTSTDREISAIIIKLADQFRFSDPVSCPEAYEEETLIYSTFEEFKKAVKSNDKDEIRRLNQDLQQLLAIRNSKTQQAKRGR